MAHRRRARGAEHRAPGEAFSLMTQPDFWCVWRLEVENCLTVLDSSVS